MILKFLIGRVFIEPIIDETDIINSLCINFSVGELKGYSKGAVFASIVSSSFCLVIQLLVQVVCCDDLINASKLMCRLNRAVR